MKILFVLLPRALLVRRSAAPGQEEKRLISISRGRDLGPMRRTTRKAMRALKTRIGCFILLLFFATIPKVCGTRTIELPVGRAQVSGFSSIGRVTHPPWHLFHHSSCVVQQKTFLLCLGHTESLTFFLTGPVSLLQTI